ncbi:MAG: glutaredoxin family protein [Mycobacteriales bacterium]
MSDPPDELLSYWRPGCGFCALLRRALRRAGIPVREINIWDDPAGAAAVRRVARGTETVPTVVIGDVALVNPSMRRVLAVLRDRAPQLIPDTGPGAAQPAGDNRDWRPAFAAVIVAVGWLVLALTNPRTTYHLAPLLTAAAWPVVARWMAGERLRRDGDRHRARGGAGPVRRCTWGAHHNPTIRAMTYRVGHDRSAQCARAGGHSPTKNGTRNNP